MILCRLAVGSSPTGLTMQTNAFRPNLTSPRRRVPRPSPEIAAERRRSPSGMGALWPKGRHVPQL
jgi:hypothetical protein